MSGLIGYVIWAATSFALGFNGFPWPWCLLLPAFGFPLNYCFPTVTTLLRKGRALFLSDLRGGGIKWLLWVYLSHVPVSLLCFALGRGAHAVL